MGREPENTSVADQGAGRGGRKVVLSQVQGGIEEHRHVGAVIDDKEGSGGGAHAGDSFGLVENFAREVCFMTELEDADAGVEEGFGCGDEAESAMGE